MNLEAMKKHLESGGAIVAPSDPAEAVELLSRLGSLFDEPVALTPDPLDVPKVYALRKWIDNRQRFAKLLRELDQFCGDYITEKAVECADDPSGSPRPVDVSAFDDEIAA